MICNKCKVDKPVTEYSKDKYSKIGIKRKCKACYREYDVTYNVNQREQISKRKTQYYLSNTETIKAYRSSLERRKYMVDYVRNRRATDHIFKMRLLLSGIARRAVEKRGIGYEHFVGCTAEQFVRHIQRLFTEGMSWGNHGYRGWHVDHITPLSLFDLDSPEQVLAATNYTNLQPMWGTENMSKNRRLPKNMLHPRIMFKDYSDLTDSDWLEIEKSVEELVDHNNEFRHG